MAQINSTVGDLKGNIKKIEEYMKKAEKHEADLVAFPEMAVTGYPPQDLLYEKAFVRENKRVLEDLIQNNNVEIVGIVGFVDYDCAGNLYNAAAIFDGNELIGTAYKTLLPTYDVFDEDRYFKPAKEEEIRPVRVKIDGKNVKIGVEICEDLWDQEYEIKVTDLLAERGADLIINVSASPFYAGKRFERLSLLKEKAIKNKVPIFYVNLVGGQDELVFDGQSLAVDASGNLIAFAKQFEEDLVIVDINLKDGTAPKVNPPPYNKEEEMFNALVLGVRDYFRKTGLKKLLLE